MGELTELLLFGGCFLGPLLAASLDCDLAGEAVAGLSLGVAAPGIFVALVEGVPFVLAEARVLVPELAGVGVDLPEPLEMAGLDLPLPLATAGLDAAGEEPG